MTLTYSLDHHPRGYGMEWYEWLHGFAVSPYAFRHLDLADSPDISSQDRLGHHIVAAIQFMPVLGFIASLIERLVVAIFNEFFNIVENISPSRSPEIPQDQNTEDTEDEKDFFIEVLNPPQSQKGTSAIPIPEPIPLHALQDVKTPSPIKNGVLVSSANSAFSRKTPTTPEPIPSPVKLKPLKSRKFTTAEADSRMLRNFQRALEAKRAKPGTNNAALVPGSVDIPNRKLNYDLTIAFSEAEAPNKKHRPQMEDSHFKTVIEQGWLAGICDGHGDKGRLAKLVTKMFQDEFSQVLKLTSNVREAFYAMHQRIDEKVRTLIEETRNFPPEKKFEGGCTCLICYVDKATHAIYTSTLGDTEAKVYRMIDGELKSVPLSGVRDWHHPTDRKRAEKWFAENKAKEMKERFLKAKDKDRRFPESGIIENDKVKLDSFGVNVSRAFGDVQFPAVSINPVVTRHFLMPGDILILACDGHWDFSDEKSFMENIIAAYRKNSKTNLAQKTVDFALLSGSTDNVTALAAYIT